MIDPSVTESGIGIVITSVIVGMMRSFRLDQSRARKQWERRIEEDLQRVEKVIVSFKRELDHERQQRADMGDKMIALMAKMASNQENMSQLSRAFAGFVKTSDERLTRNEQIQSEVIELSKNLRLIRLKKEGHK